MGKPSITSFDCSACLCIPIMTSIIPMHTHAEAIRWIRLPWVRCMVERGRITEAEPHDHG